MNHETLCQLVSEQADKIAALESRLAALESASSASSVTALEARLTAVEGIVGTPEHGDATATASASTTAPTT